MIADWQRGFVVESEWTPAGRYRLTLSNHGAAPLTEFRLGLSGPGRLGEGVQVHGGTLVRVVSTCAEIAPAPGFVLAPGEGWSIEIDGLHTPLRHWTDGTAAGFVIDASGDAVAALTMPTRREGSTGTDRRGTVRLPVPATPPVPVSIVPWPQKVKVSGRRSAPEGLAISAADQAGEAAEAAFRQLTTLLFGGEGLVRTFNEGGFAVIMKPDAALAQEAYRIEFERERVIVAASAATGYLYALVSLGQVLRGARLHPQSYVFPTAGHIEDAPAMAWRGCHLDVARRFYAGAELERFLAILCWNKLNVLQLHLSDDEAWRIEIAAYPELTARAAWRGHGLDIPPLLGSGPERAGGYYARDDIRALVQLGEALGIEIVPEIDMPGHCHALLQALPQLVDPGETGRYHSVQGFANNCLNPAVEAVYQVAGAILSELVELFPSRHFHIGGDEVPQGAWAGSPLAQELGRQLGAPGAAALQAHFLRRMQALLAAKGRVTGAWEEAAAGGGIDKDACYLVGWRDGAAGRRLAAAGYNVVLAPAQACYLDMANAEDWYEPGASWAGWSSPATTYALSPGEGWSAAERARLLGVQACIWSEHMGDRAVFDRLVFPRLSAVAEAGWTAPEARDFGRFAAAAGLMPNMYGQFEQG